MLYPLDDYDRAPITWLWPNLIPRGKITLLSGDPGAGKSLLALHLAAAISRNADPATYRPSDHPPPPPGTHTPHYLSQGPATGGDTMILAAEDDVNDTIIPRLESLNADRSRIHLGHRQMRHIHEPGPTDHLTDHVGASRIYHAFGRLQQGTDTEADRRLVGKGTDPIRRYDRREALDLTDLMDRNEILSDLKQLRNPTLLIVDTIASHLGDHSVTSNKAIRAAMDFLSEVAHNYKMAVVVLCHNSKGQHHKYIHKALGSLYLTSVARSVLTITEDTAAPLGSPSSDFPISDFQSPISAGRLLVPIKSNCTLPHNPIPFTIENGQLRFGPPRPPAPPKLSKLEQAKKFLREFLTQSTKSKLVKAHARELNIGNTTLHDAAHDLGITISRSKTKKPNIKDLTYYFHPPEPPTQPPTVAPQPVPAPPPPESRVPDPESPPRVTKPTEPPAPASPTDAKCPMPDASPSESRVPDPESPPPVTNSPEPLDPQAPMPTPPNPESQIPNPSLP